ncbi:flagella basal body P-ring formation protein FlgA [Halomonas fontilapidosi]|uniref:Flagella basal body P-ring formation protein FlgA n=1 Tax=Halomonas fontilapidosi TaxID=616675 RepID=A0A7W5DHS0_9GAMM|nr:flagellar basal body P-ring formation chaperone FlgA [Halomonas fontilapidosi]MBB3182881.1 flagella basal body P-ring formation protein FlgA [Halomonas fontilapidosi]
MPRYCPPPHRFPLVARLLVLAVLLLAGPSQADEAAMLAKIHAFLYAQASASGEEVMIEVHPSRATLPACENPTPFLPNTSTRPAGRVSVGVRCGDQGRQVRYFQAEIHITGRYVETARDIKAGETVRPEHLVERLGNLSRLPRQSILDPDEAIGQEATRPLAAGMTLQDHHLRPRQLVKRGQRVVIEAQGSGFRIAREAEALEPGGKGEYVRVRLPDREILEARVVDQGRLTVDF